MNGLTASKSGGQAAILSELKAAGRRVVDLSLGEFKVPPPPQLVEAMGRAVATASNLYTDTIGIADLRALIAVRVSRASGRAFGAENVAVTAGAKQALFNAAAALLEVGDEILIPSPYWTTFPAQAQLVGAVPVRVDLAPHSYEPAIEAFRASVTPRTRALLLNSPNNPTGRVYTRDEWLALFEFAKSNKLIVIVDECYKDYCFPRSLYVSPATLWDGPEEDFILVDSFSKSLSLTGWRLGFVIAHPKVIAGMRTVQNHTTSNPSSIVQHAMALALRETDFASFIAARWSDLSDNRRKILERVEFIRRDTARIPNGGFFFYVDTSGLTGPDREWKNVNDVCNSLLSETGVLVVPGTSFGDTDGFRMSICGTAADVSTAAEQLDAFFRGRGL